MPGPVLLTPYRGTAASLGKMAGLTTGKFAAGGAGVETVRFYQRRGLLALPERRGRPSVSTPWQTGGGWPSSAGQGGSGLPAGRWARRQLPRVPAAPVPSPGRPGRTAGRGSRLPPLSLAATCACSETFEHISFIRAETGRSEPRVDRLALQREHAEHAFVHAKGGLAADEPLERLDSQRALGGGQRPLAPEAALPQPVQVTGQRVLRPVDDPQALRPPALDPRLGDAAPAPHDRLGRLDHHALPASSGKLLPPPRHGRIRPWVRENDRQLASGG